MELVQNVPQGINIICTTTNTPEPRNVFQLPVQMLRSCQALNVYHVQPIVMCAATHTHVRLVQQVMILLNGVCSRECADGTYKDSNVCRECPYGCRLCESASVCVECFDENAAANMLCESCYSGYYAENFYSTAVTCIKCPANCYECDSSSNCTSCPYYSSWDGTRCVCDDQTIEYEGLCYQNTLLTGSPDCQRADQYPYGSGECTDCHPSCETCIGPGPDICIDCKGATDSTCQDTTVGLYNYIRSHASHTDYQIFSCYCPDGTADMGGFCESCAAQCATCTTVSVCDTCAEGFVTSNTNGVTSCSCPIGHVQQGAECLPLIHTACATARTYPEGVECKDCDSSCSSCEGAASTQCLSCRQGMTFSLYESNTLGQCVCNEGAWLENEERCGCEVGCASCHSNRGEYICSACLPGWVMNGQACTCDSPKTQTCDGECISERGVCEDLWYANGDVCEPCLAPCLECTNIDVCLSCADPNHVVGNGGLCECAAHLTEINGQCLCETGMQTICDGEIILGCYAQVPKYFSELDSANAVHDYACHNSCLFCLNESAESCTSCPNGAIFVPTNVRDSCGVATEVGTCGCDSGFYQKTDGTCAQCHANCRECTGTSKKECAANSCVHDDLIVANEPNTCDCDRHYYWTGNQCEPTNYWEQYDLFFDQYFNVTTQLPGNCHDTCVSCAGPEEYDCYACGPEAFYGIFTVSTDGRYSGNCECPNDMFVDTGTWDRSCAYCHESCDSPAGCTGVGCNACHESGPENCVECKPGREWRVRDDGQSVCECKDKYTELETGECRLSNFDAECDLTTYAIDGGCQPCGTECLRCSQDLCDLCIPSDWQFSSDNWNCEPPSCEGNMFWNGYACQDCDHSCQGCLYEGAQGCLACADPLAELNADDTTQTGVCVCRGACQDIETGVCLGTCDVTFDSDNKPRFTYLQYNNGTAECLPCHESCAAGCLGPYNYQCIDSPIVAESCNAPYRRSDWTGYSCDQYYCYCPENEAIYDTATGTCTACGENMYPNYQIDPIACVCIEGFIAKASGGCMIPPPEECATLTEFLNNDVCEACNPICASCVTSADNCTACADEYRTNYHPDRTIDSYNEPPTGSM